MSTMAGSNGKCIFSFKRTCQIIFQSDFTIFIYYQQSICYFVSLDLCQHLVVPLFIILAILIDMHWYLLVVFNCIAPVAHDVEHLFMYLLAKCVSSSGKYLFISFVHFLSGLLVFFTVNFWEFFTYARY